MSSNGGGFFFRPNIASSKLTRRQKFFLRKSREHVLTLRGSKILWDKIARPHRKSL